MPLVKICSRCGATDVPAGRSCPRCEPTRRARDEARRRAKPQRKIWDSARWKRTRARVLQRDGYRCQRCGRERSELKPNELLLAHHVRGLTPILAEGGDPFALDELECLCSKCSGREDGRRARAAAL